jgi:hypothetical protein
VHIHDMGRLADRLGNQIEAIADRCAAAAEYMPASEARNGAVSVIMTLLVRRLAGHAGLRDTLLLAAVPKPEGQPRG